MTYPTYGAGARLARLSSALEGAVPSLPSLFAFTDPVRTPDPVELAEALPTGTGLVLRTFGRAEIEAKAALISAIAELRGLTFLIAGDPDLAADVAAHGVHWPEAQLGRAARRRFRGLQTASAHSPMAVRRAQCLVDAVFLSTAFASSSPSAHAPLGPFRLQAYARRGRCPIYALGGINTRTIKRLTHTKLSGVAAIDGLSEVVRD